ncbi:pimeloyl-ACP methyl ester carboxylesterase [Stella humosa]|uniref:Pimeloyl-ACP methyl ester carboxylesterase n=1 Tax=Stella humosa TaxID=94 RepID=A0A3N1M9Y1_9PROT|nr:alpha/beta fold hydrolase [Stella humosa]ROP99496.1 pimeloyl-ACP methyl ester carboxylesterase [Stella humosa]BBK31290.1 hydrolase [Stella humosa]
MAEVEHHFARLSQVAMHYVTAGEGPPVVLLHGWPSTWYEWRHVIDRLAPHHRVIAPDLRGLGDSSRPADGYDKRTVAADVWELVEHLGLGRFHLVGHDWGGPTAFALAAAHPEAIRTLSIVDVTLPGIGPDISQGGRRWHHAFHRTLDLPEALVTGRERPYLSWFYAEFSWQQGAITDADIDEYVRTYSKPGALRAGFAYYRNIPQDAADNVRLLESGFRLPMPVLALGGARTEARARGLEPAESLGCIADRVEGGTIAESGHFVPEEQPDALSARLMEFWRQHPDG